MRYYAALFCFFICLISLLLFQTSVALATEKAIHDLLSLPEKKIDVGRAALIVAKDIYPNLNVDEYSSKIDDMVKIAARYANGSTDPTYRIRSIITVFYLQGIRYDYADPYLKKKSNKYINGLIDTKKGACVTMPTLFLAIAQRLGYPIYGVKAPDHFFLRYDDPSYRESNIEITAGGGYAPDEEYVKQFNIPQKAIKSGEYLRMLKHREMVADLVAEVAIEWAHRGDLLKAIRYFEHAFKVFPRSGGINFNLGRAYMQMAEQSSGEDKEKNREKALFYSKRAEALGFTKLPMEAYAAKIKALANNEQKGK